MENNTQNTQLSQLLGFYKEITEKFGAVPRLEFLESYNIFGEWLHSCLMLEPIPKKIKGVYLGIYEAPDNTMQVYISGSKKWKASDAEWTGRHDYLPAEKDCPDLPVLEICYGRMREKPFEGAEFATEIIIAYLITYCHFYPSSCLNREKIHLAVGFDEGDLIIL